MTPASVPPSPLSPPLLLIGNIGPTELVIILVIGLLLFGRRLPDVGRSLGRTIVEFKKGMKGLESQVNEIDRETDRIASEEEKRLARGPGATTAAAAPASETKAPAENDREVPSP